ncbi:unnamed protein product [Durusdinium trenchii]|uniref:RING-type domain-containing protein n=1 Tax=Durusdinium trenchii TaxID=1381693 RepID=A0ABP0I3T4_9DINO
MEFWTLTGWIIAGVFAVLGAAVFSAFLLPHSYLLQKPEPEDLKAAIERELPEAQPGEGDVCSVCLEGFDVASAKQLKCKHCYHSDCLTSWARSEQRRRQTPHGLVRIVCPLCGALDVAVG